MDSEENFGTKKGAINEMCTDTGSMHFEAPLLLLGPSVCIKEDPELNLEFEETENVVTSQRLPISCQFKRISNRQRELMLDFMMKHPTLATGRFTGPGAAKGKQQLLKELATMLNSLPNGVVKTEDKWLKSWQDWRSDVKSKASTLKEIKKTGGSANSNAKSLTPLEQKLLDFLGLCVSGHEEVPDFLTIAHHQDSGHGLVTQTDRDVEGPVEVNEYVGHNIDLHQDLVLPLEGSTKMSAAADVSLGHVPPGHVSPSPASAEENVPTSSGGMPASHNSEFSSRSTPAKKRKHSTNGNSTHDEDPLVTITREQLICLQEQNTFRRVQLELDERKTTAIENASVAFIGAMKALEEYLRHKKGDD